MYIIIIIITVPVPSIHRLIIRYTIIHSESVEGKWNEKKKGKYEVLYASAAVSVPVGSYNIYIYDN